jgi:hypothetical protein
LGFVLATIMKSVKPHVVFLIFAGLFAVLYLGYLFVPLDFRISINSTPTTTMTPDPLGGDFILACREIALLVEQGDTLDSISVNYGVPRDYIKQYNRMETDEVFPGGTLLIPMCSNMPTPTATPTK